ncbi:MAG: septal ring lytic transglycosylase RlpA family protein [Alphaproteobacteria bacterium]
MNAHTRFLNTAVLLLCTVLLLSGCAESQLVSHWAKKVTWPGQQENAGTYKVGKPYRVGSVWYTPKEDFNLSETGIASWYGPDFHGHHTANGEIYDQDELTAAHRTLQMPSLVRVTNLENGRSVVVRINDRGPFKNGRVIDVSKRSATLLGFIGRGTARVRIDVLARESRLIAEAARRGADTSRLTMADLQKYENTRVAADEPEMRPSPVQAVEAEPVRVAASDNSLPESLQTPTITVEQLSAPRTAPVPSYSEPEWTPPPAQAEISQSERADFVKNLNLDEDSARQTNRRGGLTPGRIEGGHFMPAEVVSQEKVRPTGIFVQAGAFAVKGNAERLGSKLSGIAPVVIDPIQSGGRTLYRVKLGPLASVSKADQVLDKVIKAGNGPAKVIRN